MPKLFNITPKWSATQQNARVQRAELHRFYSFFVLYLLKHSLSIVNLDIENMRDELARICLLSKYFKFSNLFQNKMDEVKTDEMAEVKTDETAEVKKVEDLTIKENDDTIKTENDDTITTENNDTIKTGNDDTIKTENDGTIKNETDNINEDLTKLYEELELSNEDFDTRVSELFASFTPDQQRYILKELRVREFCLLLFTCARMQIKFLGIAIVWRTKQATISHVNHAKSQRSSPPTRRSSSAPIAANSGSANRKYPLNHRAHRLHTRGDRRPAKISSAARLNRRRSVEARL